MRERGSDGEREGGKDGRPNSGGRALRGTFKSAVSCGRRRGEGGERPDRSKREEEEGGTDGRTAGAGGYGALRNQLWVVGGGAGREENDQTKERGGRMRRNMIGGKGAPPHFWHHL